MRDDLRATEGILAKCEFFKGFPKKGLHTLLQSAGNKIYPAEQLIFQKGDEGLFLYVILRGCVEISTTSGHGQQIRFNLIEEGEAFGEVSVIDGGRRTATAIAKDETHLLLIPRDTLIRYLDTEPQLYKNVLNLTCKWLRRASELSEDLAFLESPERIIKALKTLSEPVDAKDNKITYEVSLSQEDLAHILGMTRETVNRSLKNLESKKIIKVSRRRITLLDAKRLDGLLKGARNETTLLLMAKDTSRDI